MSQYKKQHVAYFESDAGRELIESCKSHKRQMYYKAESATDIQEAFAYLNRAKGIQEALDTIMSMTAGGTPPKQ